MISSGVSGEDLVIEQFATEVVELRERVALTDSYREALQAALERLTERTRELKGARRRIAALVAELRARSGTDVVA